MDQAWKSINGFIVSFILKILPITIEKEYIPVLNLKKDGKANPFWSNYLKV